MAEKRNIWIPTNKDGQMLQYTGQTTDDVTPDNVRTFDDGNGNILEEFGSMTKQTSIADIRLMGGTGKPAGNPNITYITNDYDCLGQWVLDPDDTTSTDNTGTILVDAAGNRYKRKFDNVINVKWFGATGDGSTDDTASIQAAFNIGGNILIPSGTCMIDAITMLEVVSNSHITWSKNAIFKAITNSASSYRILELKDISNVILTSPQLEGDRYDHTGTTGEQGHGLVISNATNVKITNAKCTNMWGDGLAIYGGSDISIIDILCDFNRRQGLTITSGTNVIIRNAILSNSDGTSPMSGLDIEPNSSDDVIDNIVIDSPITKGNLGTGISISLIQLLGANKTISIKILNHQDYGSVSAFTVGKLTYNDTYSIDGEILNQNPVYVESGSGSIFIDNYSALHTPSVKIISPKILNPNANDEATIYGAGISIHRSAADAGTDTNPIGNVLISNPHIVDNRATPLMTRGIYIADDAGIDIENVIVDNPIHIEGLDTESHRITPTAGDVKINDNNKSLFLTTIASTTIVDVIKHIDNLGATAKTVITLSQAVLNTPIVLTNSTIFGMRVTPESGATIYPYVSEAGGYIETSDVGASIILRKKSSTEYIVDNIVGKWTTAIPNNVIYNLANAAKYYTKYDAVSSTSPATLVDFAGDEFSTSKAYKVQAWRSGSAFADIMSEAIFRYNGTSWDVVNVLSGGTSDNNIKLYVNSAKPSVALYGSTEFSVHTITEEVISSSSATRASIPWNPNITDDNTTLKYKGDALLTDVPTLDTVLTAGATSTLGATIANLTITDVKSAAALATDANGKVIAGTAPSIDYSKSGAITAVSADYTVLSTDEVVLITLDAADATITYPDTATARKKFLFSWYNPNGKQIQFTNSGGTTNVVTSVNGAYEILWDGTKWWELRKW